MRALRFAHHILGLTGAEDVVSSQRVIGCAKLAYLRKRRLVQKDPLSVAMVVAMEAFVADLEKPSRERFVIGFFLICTFMRARFSDIMHYNGWDGSGQVFLPESHKHLS